MPEPLHPPFVAAAQAIPRQLNRWLDVNPQGGPLGRTQTYITLPSFSQAFTWNGYSEIVASFNFEGPNNFSLKSIGGLPSSPNYLLCISYVDSSNKMHRYAIWEGVGEVLFFDVPLYTGQPIGKNFRFEIWNTPTTPAIQTTPLTFYTTVRGGYDYRFQADIILAGDDGKQSSFQYNQQSISLPSNLNNLQCIHWDGSIYAINNVSWDSINAPGITTFTSATLTQNTILYNGNTYKSVIDNSANLTVSPQPTPVNNLFVVFKFNGFSAGTNQFITYDGGYDVKIIGVTGTPNVSYLQVNGHNFTSYHLEAGKVYLLAINVGINVILLDINSEYNYIYDNTLSVTPTTNTLLTVGSNTTSQQVIEILPYFSVQDHAHYIQIYEYFQLKYGGGYTLPLQFPVGSTSTINT